MKKESEWDESDLARYQDRSSVRKSLERNECRLQLFASQLDNLVKILRQERQFALGTDHIPVITTLQHFLSLKGIPFKETPGNVLLSANAFAMTVDRDEVLEKLFRFFIEREMDFGTQWEVFTSLEF